MLISANRMDSSYGAGCFRKVAGHGKGGHFLCLRSIGLPAEEFAIGFGPQAMSNCALSNLRNQMIDSG